MKSYKLMILSAISGLLLITQLQASTLLTEANRILVDYDFTGKPLPKWQGGALLAVDSSGGLSVRLSVFDKTGTRIQDHLVQIEGSKYLTVRDYVRAADGTLGICGGAVDVEGRSSSFIAFVHPTNRSTTLVRTGAFKPMRMTVSSNETFWVAGYEIEPIGPGGKLRATLSEAVNKNASMFRQFDKNGKLLLSAVPHTAIDDPHSISEPNASSLFAELGNEIVWYAGRSRQLIAISRDGSFTEIRDLKLPEDQRQTGFGITEKGEIIVSAMGKTSWSVVKLMPSKRDWQFLAQGANGDRANRPILVIGAEGNVINSLGGGNSGIRTFQLMD